MSSEFASADLTAGQLNALVKKVGGREKVLQILSDVVEVVMKAVSFLTSTTKQTVNYNRSITDSLTAGKYDWKNENITDANFPSKEEGEREVEFGLFHFNKTTKSDDNVAQMKKEGFRPATMKELLVFGEKNPEEQRKYPIIALGSVAKLDGYRRVGCLYGGGSGRGVNLDYYDGEWNDDCRFLGVRI
jgi:ABC-type uncharacterized transport system YnjBCD substrate-binding protein